MFDAMPKPLAAGEIETALAALPGWAYVDGALRKTFLFGSFREAVSFIVRLAFSAEALNHHPELRNVYSRVEVALSTHDADDQVTARDTELAAEIEAFSWV